MGIIKQGILGGVSGGVGTVIGGSWKGIDYVRSRPSSVANPNSDKQVDQRSKFSSVIGFLKPLTGLVTVTFRNYAIGMSGFNVAMSYNIKNAITGTSPDFTIDYTLALLSQGDLSKAFNPSVAVSGSNTIAYSWVNNSDEGNANEDDQAILMAYFESNGQAVYQFTTVKRTAVTANLSIPASYTGLVAKCWIAFQTADGKGFSNSIYIGEVTMA